MSKNLQSDTCTTNDTINIAIIAAVSAGKSTLTNSLFVKQYSDMNVKRTTTMPQVYTESNSTEDNPYIREQNREINTKYMQSTANGIKLKYEDIREIHYNVPKVHDLVDLVPGTNLAIYDLPGLNDSMTKEVYYRYVTENFKKFDIIIQIIDINSALNTSDETDILKLVLKGINDNMTNYKINTKLICLINKCDELTLDKTSKQYVPVDEELKEMYQQTIDIINTHKKEIYSEASIDIRCISCEDSYIYRMYRKNPSQKLDPKYINKFGSNEYGKTRWSELSDNKKQKQIVKLFKKFDYENRIEKCGFRSFATLLAQILTPKNQYDFILNHIKLELCNYNVIRSDTEIPQKLSGFINYEKRLFALQMRYSQSINPALVREYVDCTINAYESTQSKFLNNYIITNAIEYQALNNIKQTFNTIKNTFPHTRQQQNINIFALNTSINNYLIKQINNTDNEIAKIIEFIKELINNNYDNNALRTIAIDRSKNIILTVNYSQEYTKIAKNDTTITTKLTHLLQFEKSITQYIDQIAIVLKLSPLDQIKLIIYNIAALCSLWRKEISNIAFVYLAHKMHTQLSDYHFNNIPLAINLSILKNLTYIPLSLHIPSLQILFELFEIQIDESSPLLTSLFVILKNLYPNQIFTTNQIMNVAQSQTIVPSQNINDSDKEQESDENDDEDESDEKYKSNDKCKSDDEDNYEEQTESDDELGLHIDKELADSLESDDSTKPKINVISKQNSNIKKIKMQ